MAFSGNLGTEPVIERVQRHWTADPRLDPTGIEIGCFEGRTSVRLVELLSARSREPEAARLICIDPFLDRYLPDETPFDARWTYFAGQRERFRANVRHVRSRLIVHEGLSGEVLPRLRDDWANRVGVVYVDGDHRAEAVYRDAVGMLPLLAPGGIAVFDDYDWGGGLPAAFHTKRGIDRFLHEYRDRIRTLERDERFVVVQRLPAHGDRPAGASPGTRGNA